MAIVAAKWMYSHGLTMFLDNISYVVIYMFSAGLISFAFLYWKGPASIRTLTLLQWALQLIGLVAISFSSQLHEVSIAIVAIVLVSYQFRARLRAAVISW